MKRTPTKTTGLILAAVLLFTASTAFCGAVLLDKGDIQEADAESTAHGTGYVKTYAGDITPEGGRPVIVIDAGHGGIDAGTSARDGTAEKDINLAIALKLKEIAEKYPVTAVLTRADGEELLEGYDGAGGRKLYDMENRMKIIQDSEPDLVVSIHLNSYPQDTSVCGAQVFYPEAQEGSSKTTSHDFAESVQDSLRKTFSGSQGREALSKDGIYLFDNITWPIILVECGFLSNDEECEKLKNDAYQEQMAQAIWDGINEKLGLEPSGRIRVIDSANK